MSFYRLALPVVPLFLAALAVNACGDDDNAAPKADASVPFETGASETSTPVDSGNDVDTGPGACTPASFAWATPGAGALTDAVNGVALDTDGSVWVTGSFIGDTTWGAFPLTGVDKTHPTSFVAKLDAKGTVLFAKALGGDHLQFNDSGGQRVRLDADGNAYVVGSYLGELKIGTTVDLLQNNAGGADAAYIVKLDKDGNALWGLTTANDGGSAEAGFDVAIDANGDVYFAGSFDGRVKFVNTPDGGIDDIDPLPSGGTSVEGAFLAKYSQTTKKWLWAKSWTGGNDSGGTALGIALTADGVTVVGTITTAISIDGTILSAASGSFVVKTAKSDGHVLWATQIANGSASTLARVAAVTADGANNVYLTGSFTGTATLESAAVVLDAGSDDAGAGSLKITVTGTGTDMLVAKYDANGAPGWVKHAGVGDLTTRGSDVAFDGASGLYIAGFKQGTPSFDAQTLTHTGDLFVARYDTSGAIQWVTANDSASTGSGDGRGIAVRSSTSGVIAGGFFNATSTFGSVSLTSAGSDDGVVTRLCN